MLEIVIVVTALIVCLTMVACVRIAIDGLLTAMKMSRENICRELSDICNSLDLMDSRLIDLAGDSDYWRKRDERDAGNDDA